MPRGRLRQGYDVGRSSRWIAGGVINSYSQAMQDYFSVTIYLTHPQGMQIELNSDRATEWIPPWTGGVRLITLWDMKEYLAPRLVELMDDITNYQVWFVYRDEEKDEDDRKAVAEARPEVAPWAKKIASEAEFLGLPSMRRQALRIAKSADKWSSKEIHDAIRELRTRFDEETEALKLFYIPIEKISFYNKTDLFGETFKASFPTANAEVIEAGNCFAFDRFTACAFHLMRSLEVVLKSLFSALTLPPLTAAGEKNWNGILRQIKDKLEQDKAIPNHDFYDGAYAFLAAAKNPMRNATMHVDAVYDEDSVRRVFDTVGAFMRHIATKLKESP